MNEHVNAWIEQAAASGLRNPYINISTEHAQALGISHLAEPIGVVQAEGYLDISIARLAEWRDTMRISGVEW